MLPADGLIQGVNHRYVSITVSFSIHDHRIVSKTFYSETIDGVLRELDRTVTEYDEQGLILISLQSMLKPGSFSKEERVKIIRTVSGYNALLNRT